MKAITHTGDEEKAVKQISKLRITIDTIGGTFQADALHHELDKRLTECYCFLTGVEGFRLDKIIVDEKIESANKQKNSLHGVNCEKVDHRSGGGYLHSGDDDSPYDVDGCSYCGRCHGSI